MQIVKNLGNNFDNVNSDIKRLTDRQDQIKSIQENLAFKVQRNQEDIKSVNQGI